MKRRTVVQAIVNRAGWASGNAMSFILKGNGSQWARHFGHSYEGSPANAVRLVIVYTSGATNTPTATRTNTPTATPTGQLAFQQSGGQVVMEAENFTTKVDRSGDAWTLTTSLAGYVGTGYMQAVPDNGSQATTGYATTSPELQFRVNFTSTGTHYVWVRMSAPDSAGDSLHLGLNGTAPTSAQFITYGSGTYNTWVWARVLNAGGNATLSVPSTGIHTVNLWMREDGAQIDRVLLTTRATYVPSGNGPAESPRSLNARQVLAEAAPKVLYGLSNPLTYTDPTGHCAEPGTPCLVENGPSPETDDLLQYLLTLLDRKNQQQINDLQLMEMLLARAYQIFPDALLALKAATNVTREGGVPFMEPESVYMYKGFTDLRLGDRGFGSLSDGGDQVSHFIGEAYIAMFLRLASTMGHVDSLGDDLSSAAIVAQELRRPDQPAWQATVDIVLGMYADRMVASMLNPSQQVSPLEALSVAVTGIQGHRQPAWYPPALRRPIGKRR